MSFEPQQYQVWMQHLQQLPVVGLITTGRTGSDFLQSLLDSHPQVLTFNGHFLIYTGFFAQSVCLRVANPECRDVIDEWIGRYIYKLASRYDIQEGKDRLGPELNQFFRIDTQEFRKHFLGLTENKPFTQRDFILAIYGAYNLCLHQDLSAARVIFHHPHLVEELPSFLTDFPNASLLFTTRDPRANFVSHVEHFRSYYPTHDNEQHVYECLRMMLEDSLPGKEYGVRYAAVRLEDLPREATLIELAKWLGVDYQDTLLDSTWAGLAWHGDRLSKKIFQSQGWSEKRTENNWRQRLGKMEQYTFNFLMNSRLQHYQYPLKKIGWIDALLVFFLLPLPMKYERYFLSWTHLRAVWGQHRHTRQFQFLLTPIFYWRRVALCYRFYFAQLRGERFQGPWIGQTEVKACES